MILHLISVVAVSASVLLAAWLFCRWRGMALPRSLIPALLAGSAILYGIYSEYTWASRTLAQFPDSFREVHRFSGTSPFAPWSYLVPRADRLSVVDTREFQSHPQHPRMVLFKLYLLQRFEPTRRVGQLVDCEGRRRTDVGGTTEFGADGLPIDTSWTALAPDDPLLGAVCPAAPTSSAGARTTP